MSISKKVQITGITIMVAGTALRLLPNFFPNCNTRTLKGAIDNLYQATAAAKISQISTYTFLGGLSMFLVGAVL